MGVNMAGNCIIDDDITREASKQEIIRRYYTALCEIRKGSITDDDIIMKLELLMKKAGVTPNDRAVIGPALQKAALTGSPAAALQLHDGRIITGRTSELLGAAAALVLNSLKALAGQDDALHLISPVIIEPIQHLKTDHLGNKNPRLHTDEALIALSICAPTDENAELAMEQLSKLRGCEVHSSVILSSVDENVFRRLGINFTCEPVYQNKKSN
jgi:uncharacterized protein (UPF0371 family)